MPPKSKAQQKFFGAALGRERAGKSLASDPKMSDASMADFARNPGGPVPKKKGKFKMMVPKNILQ